MQAYLRHPSIVKVTIITQYWHLKLVHEFPSVFWHSSELK